MSRASNIHEATDNEASLRTQILLDDLQKIATSTHDPERKRILVRKTIKTALLDFGEKVCKKQIDECSLQATSVDLKVGAVVSKHSVNMVYEELPF